MAYWGRPNATPDPAFMGARAVEKSARNIEEHLLLIKDLCPKIREYYATIERTGCHAKEKGKRVDTKKLATIKAGMTLDHDEELSKTQLGQVVEFLKKYDRLNTELRNAGENDQEEKKRLVACAKQYELDNVDLESYAKQRERDIDNLGEWLKWGEWPKEHDSSE